MGFEVVEWLRGAEERHVVDVTARLLAFIRRHEVELDAIIRDGLGRDPREPFVGGASAVVDHDSMDPEYLGPEELERAAALLEGASRGGAMLPCAAALAQAIDVDRGAHFFSRFAGQRHALSPGQPFPVPGPEVVRDEFGDAVRLTPPPDVQSVPRYFATPLDGTKRLRLAPSATSRLSLVFDARHADCIDTLFSTARVTGPGPGDAWVAIVPSTFPLDDLEWDVSPEDVAFATFANVRLRADRRERYEARVRMGLGEALREDARVVLLPELSVDHGLEQLVEEWFVAHSSVALVAAGSRHVQGADGRWRNIARVFVRRAPRDAIAHEKFSFFELRDPHAFEGIATSNTVTVHAGRRWSFAVLVCKDLLEETARRLVIDARVRAVLVPAMSPKAETFRVPAEGVARDAQAAVFVANAPCDDASFAAMLARPTLLQAPACPGREAASSARAPGVVAVFRLGSDRYDRRILPED